jgi:large subunit ribosomal protein L9
MKVILNDHVDNLGDRGATLEVKPGYARNYLFPKGLAYEATPANLARFKQETRKWEQSQAKQKGEAEAIAGQLAGVELTFVRRAGEGDALYGSVTSSDVADALAARGLAVDRRRIGLEHIKRLGTFTAEVKLHRDVRVPITLHVKPEEHEQEQGSGA